MRIFAEATQKDSLTNEASSRRSRARWHNVFERFDKHRKSAIPRRVYWRKRVLFYPR